MRDPKNPFSPAEPDDAFDPPHDRLEPAADAAPGRGSGTPPLLPRRTEDSGFRPRGGQVPPQQDFWPLTDPEDSWPLAPRPPAEPADYCSPGDRDDSWAAAAPAEGGLRDDGAQEAGPEEAWAASGPAQDDPRDYGAQADPRDYGAQADPPGYGAQADPPGYGAQADPPGYGAQADPPGYGAQADPPGYGAQADPPGYGAQADPDEAWASSGPAEGEPPALWDRGGGLEFWSPDSQPHAPRDPWRPPPVREDLRGEDLRGPARGPLRGAEPPPRRASGRGDHSAPASTGRGDLPPGGDHSFPAPSRFAGRLQEGARPPEGSGRPERSLPPEDLRPRQDDLCWEDEQRWEDEPPYPERVPAAPAGPAPDQDGDPAPASMGFQDLWESWEPPYDPKGAISEPVRHPTAPYPELVRDTERDTEYEDDLGFWETPAEAGFGGGPNYPDYPGPRRRAQHARNPGRARLNGAFLALAGALAIAGAIPLGILGVRTLAHHGNPAPKTAPLSASHAAASAPGPNGGGAFTAIAGPGCPAATSASVFPYHPTNGDEWFPGTASVSGPCGRSFSYVYLAMVPGNPGEWRDHYAWIFHTGMDNPSCTFSLYIPAAPQANSTDYYWFSAGDSNAADRIADFTIDQATHRGQWVTNGPFTFPGGTVLIEATDRGEGPLTSSVAVGPVRLSC